MVIINQTSNLGTLQVTPSNSSTQASGLGSVRAKKGPTRCLKVQKKRRASADKIHQHAIQVVASWKNVPEEAKTRILANALDQFRLPGDEATKQAILNEARDLFCYRRARLHKHYMIFATNEQRLQNKPADLSNEE
ncbi:hypothetical protein PIB30_019105 [Stylosanthes scabra]|uniref:Uncharacterized protein n=1 Tax=Stylosanthes scabra TaxID=79078 RepID=A0ABU6V695_9FABA|nr:hypothetical protein [Stylosanthes scabra]